MKVKEILKKAPTFETWYKKFSKLNDIERQVKEHGLQYLLYVTYNEGHDSGYKAGYEFGLNDADLHKTIEVLNKNVKSDDIVYINQSYLNETDQ